MRRSYKQVQVESPGILRLRELARSEEELKTELRRTTNRLWQQLHRYYPQILKLSPAADDRFIWDLLSKVPTPQRAAKITRARLALVLATHRILRFTVEEVLAILRATPLVLAAGAAEAASEHVLLLLPQITLLDQQLRDVGSRIRQMLKVGWKPIKDKARHHATRAWFYPFQALGQL